MKSFVVIFSVFTFTLLKDVTSQGDFAELTIADGKIRGRKSQTVGEGKVYYSFRGIPYAKPPVGDLRFKSPVKNDRWNGILDATEDKSQCTQGTDAVEGLEDCLYINVYTPSLNTSGYAVMVWIHGGGTYGNSSYLLYGPDYLLENNIIFVSLNFRLGPFGFLSTEDLSCPGNMGQKDQVLALKWVQRNIRYFGGDPKLVTINGESAGAAFVGYLVQSSTTQGLFRGAILESGDTLSVWSLQRKAREIAFETGKNLGINTNNSKELIEKLRQVDYASLQRSGNNVTYTTTLENTMTGKWFFTVKEPENPTAFFCGESDRDLRNGDFHRVTILHGFNSNEGASIQSFPEAVLRNFIPEDSSILVPVDLTTNNNSIVLAGREIRNKYFTEAPIGTQVAAMAQYITDDFYKRPTRRYVMNTKKFIDIYLYQFSYEGLLGFLVNRTLKGTAHAEDLGYLFRTYFEFTIPESDVLTRARMTRLWTNFVKYLNPTPRRDPLLQNVLWPKICDSTRKLVYYDINKNITVGQNIPFEAARFWDDIYHKYGTPPYDTY